MDVTQIEQAGEILLANNENFLAKALYARELQKDLGNSELLLRLGNSYLKSQDFQSALKCYQQLQRQTISFDSCYYIARCYEGMGELISAKESYLDALLQNTTNSDLLFETYKSMGNLFLKEKNLDMAEDFYHKAYTLCPGSSQLLVNMGTLEIQRNDFATAIEKFRKALSFSPRSSAAWVGMALCYQSFGDLEMAWGSVLKATEGDPDNATALLLLAQWGERHSGVERAQTALMEHFDRGHFDAQLSLAFVELALRKGEFHLARIELERALLWEPNNSELLQFDKALGNHGF
jgi:tetratricopeptide (TPR) repeat protein